MKLKEIFALLTILAILLGNSENVFAEIYYDSNTCTYESSNETDGILCVNSEIENIESFIEKNNTLYMENIVPTDENINNEDSKKQLIDNVGKVIFFKSSYLRPIFKYVSSSGEYDIKILDKSSNKIIAIGKNLKSNKCYKLTFDCDAKDIEFSVEDKSQYMYKNLNKDTSLNKSYLVVGSTNSKQAETPKNTNIIQYRSFFTGYVPKNIDGNQGRIMESHTMEFTAMLATYFLSSTNDMSSVNITYNYDGNPIGYYGRNIPVGSRFKPSITFGSGFDVDIIMSTNSNSGEAEISVREQGY